MISPEHAVMVAKRIAPAGMIVGNLALAGCVGHGRISADVYLTSQITPHVLTVGVILIDPDRDTSRAVTVGVRPLEVFETASDVTIGGGRVFSRYDERAFGLTLDKNGLHGSLPVGKGP